MATSTDDVYNWYLGQHSFLHNLAGNRLLSMYPRLSNGLPAIEYNAQLAKLEAAAKASNGKTE